MTYKHEHSQKADGIYWDDNYGSARLTIRTIADHRAAQLLHGHPSLRACRTDEL